MRVIPSSLLIIAKHLERPEDLPKSLVRLGSSILWHLVGMLAKGQLPESLLDVVARSILRHAQQLVQIVGLPCSRRSRAMPSVRRPRTGSRLLLAHRRNARRESKRKSARRSCVSDYVRRSTIMQGRRNKWEWRTARSRRAAAAYARQRPDVSDRSRTKRENEMHGRAALDLELRDRFVLIPARVSDYNLEKRTSACR